MRPRLAQEDVLTRGVFTHDGHPVQRARPQDRADGDDRPCQDQPAQPQRRVHPRQRIGQHQGEGQGHQPEPDRGRDASQGVVGRGQMHRRRAQGQQHRQQRHRTSPKAQRGRPAQAARDQHRGQGHGQDQSLGQGGGQGQPLAQHDAVRLELHQRQGQPGQTDHREQQAGPVQPRAHQSRKPAWVRWSRATVAAGSPPIWMRPFSSCRVSRSSDEKIGARMSGISGCASRTSARMIGAG